MKQLKYIAHYQKDRNWGQINFVVTLAKKDILRIEQMSPETTAYKKTLASHPSTAQKEGRILTPFSKKFPKSFLALFLGNKKAPAPLALK